MTDLSLPPLTLLPKDGKQAGDTRPAALDEPVTAEAGAERFAWPTPQLSSYPAPHAIGDALPCEVEGLNGKAMAGRVVRFSPGAGQVQLLMANMRQPLTLRFDQFRRLTLTQTLAPLSSALGADPANPLNHRDPVPYSLQFEGGPTRDGWTLGVAETAAGIFLFEPVDNHGSVRRSFVPRQAVAHFELGERIGELLVEQAAASSEQVEQAVAQQAALRQQKLGEVLLARQVLTAEQLDEAIAQQGQMPMVRIGEALIALGYIDQAQLEAALAQQKLERELPLGEVLIRQGVVTRQDVQLALSRKMGYPMVDVQKFAVDTEALGRVPHVVAQRLGVLPLMLRAGRLVVALEDPTQRKAVEEVEFVSQLKAVPVLAEADALRAAIDRAYDRIGIGAWLPPDGLEITPELAPRAEGPDVRGLLATMERDDERAIELSEEPQIEQSDNSLVKLINTMILEAQAQRVSDIHVECAPGRDKVRIRFRKDGRLAPYLELPHTYRAALLARLKIMCDLDISERRKPQDGKITFGKFHPGARLELRLATIPTQGGLEDAVLRLLASAKPLPLTEIGLSAHNLEALKAAVNRPYGMVLCVGPTGSGKTTTLHSALASINQPDRKIWTAEDPVEITQKGLRQVQVNPKIDWTFAKALRAFLRADPDVIMVGEIRDQETAQVAIEASLTGHLVLSTLHTNSAAETVTRLLDMGMDPFNFADSLIAVLAQRLVRRICPSCRTRRPATEAEIDELADDWLNAWGDAEGKPTRGALIDGWKARHARDGRLMFTHAPGCAACEHTGFKGRLALHELMTVSRPMRRHIQSSARAEELQRAAIGEGMRTLRQDGIEKVLAGELTIEDVRASSNV